jgi:phytoene synthase
MQSVAVAGAHRRLVASGIRSSVRVARRQARTFYIAFCLLPPERRRAICTLYAFSRSVDDAADAPGLTLEQRRRRLEDCRARLGSAFRGDPSNPQLAALADVAERHRIPQTMLETLVDGVSMDLEPRRHRDIEDLRTYCHAVAGVVGQMCIRIFGATDPSADSLADELGFALQVTNILRDISEDAGVGRFYLPLDELEAAGIDEAAVLAHRGEPGTAAMRLLAFQGERAATAFRAVEDLRPLVPRSSRPCLEGIASLYAALLQRLRSRNYAVSGPRVSIPTATKVAIAAGAAVRGVLR